jgi:hypothetical protein
MKTISELFADWNENIKPAVTAQYGANDTPALSESWNDFTDAECKDGNITDLAYHFCPAWDDKMPDSDTDFILDAMGVSFDCSSILERPDGVGDWGADATHWRINIKRGAEVMTVHYSMGSAHTGEPQDADVFNSLLMDTSDIEGETFEDWAENLGYDTDSRKAEKAFNACKEEFESLQRLFSKSELVDLREIFADY